MLGLCRCGVMLLWHVLCCPDTVLSCQGVALCPMCWAVP